MEVFFEDRAHVSSRCCRFNSRLLAFDLLNWSCRQIGGLGRVFAVDSGEDGRGLSGKECGGHGTCSDHVRDESVPIVFITIFLVAVLFQEHRLLIFSQDGKRWSCFFRQS